MKRAHTGNRIVRHALTLVELLVVISIMVMLAAISIPMFKPILESQRTRNGAQTLSTVLQQVRFKAMREKRPYGVEFVRYIADENINNQSGTGTNLSVQLRLLREGNKMTDLPNLVTSVGESFSAGAVVENGQIRLYRYNTYYDSSGAVTTTNRPWIEIPDGSDITKPRDAYYVAWERWDDLVSPGDSIKFGFQGRSYRMADNSNRRLADPYGSPGNSRGLTLPQPTPGSNHAFYIATTFLLPSYPRPSLAPPISLPRGTVVDLQFSGFRNPYLNNNNPNDPNPNYRSFSSFNSSYKVRVMFSPNGTVDYCEYGTGNDRFDPHSGLFYFLVGEWDRQAINLQGETLTEDGLNNVQVSSSFWVTVNPRGGEIRATEINPPRETNIQNWKNETDPNDKRIRLETMLEPAREFASEYFTNLGGF